MLDRKLYKPADAPMDMYAVSVEESTKLLSKQCMQGWLTGKPGHVCTGGSASGR